MTSTGGATGRERMPADIELEDRLAFGLTARQLLILVAATLTAYTIFLLAARAAPLPVAAALAAPPAVVGVALVFGRRDGLPGDRLALTVSRYLRRPRRLLLAPEGLPTPARKGVAPLDLPIRAVLRCGLIELGPDGHALLLRATGASFALRADEERSALVEGFGRFLNALAEPITLIVQSVPTDLAAHAERVERAAAELPHPDLAGAARSHARFLRSTGADARRRDVLLCLRTSTRARETALSTLERRAREAGELLQHAAVSLQPIRGEEAADLYARVLAPPGPAAGSSLHGVVRGPQEERPR